jgi:hypothetical protein
LYKLLSREEVIVAAQVFDHLSGITDFADLTMEQVCSMYDNQLAPCPNLKTLLREENAPLLAYLRFAPRPLRLREFLRMLCPAADERELEAFEAWGRHVDLHERPVSRSGRHLPALERPSSETPRGVRKPKPGAPLSSPASAAELDRQSPLLAPAKPATPRSSTPTAFRPTSACKVRAIRGLPLPRTPRVQADDAGYPGEAATAEAAVEQPVRKPDKMQEQLRRYVQQRYVELMMVDGMDPNEACALALREAPTVLANPVSNDSPLHILSAGLSGRDQSDLAGDPKYSARSVYA